MKNFDITDYIVSGDVEKVASLAAECGDDVGKTYIPSLEENAKKDPEEFAVCIYHPRHGFMNKYAVYSKGLTELNLALLNTQLQEIPDEVIKVASTNLQKAAAHYQLEFPETLESYVMNDNLENNIVDITNIDETSYHIKLSESKPPVKHIYALPKKEKYPITDEELIKTAENYFNTYNNELNIGDRIEFANNINKQMLALGMSPTGLIDKLAHLDYSKLNEDFKYHIESRKTLSHDEETVGLYEELFEKSAEWTTYKVASILGKIDEKADLTYYYGRNLSDPVTSTFGITKEAEYEIDGRIWKESDFDKIGNADFGDMLDNNTLSELSGESKVDVFRSLPKPIRENIANEIL